MYKETEPAFHLTMEAIDKVVARELKYVAYEAELADDRYRNAAHILLEYYQPKD